MQMLVHVFAPAMLFFAALFGTHTAAPAQTSVELGLYEVSPRGDAGGFAMPASGCSPADPQWHGYPIHDCAVHPDISVDKPIIRLGESVIVSWDPHTHTNCVLSNNVMALTPVPDGNVAGNRTDYPTGETTYSIVCDGAGNEDSATVKVLPRIQET
jgi:hypothetical protein